MRNDQVFVLDLDGTIYLENTLIDGALEFLEALKKQQRRFVFLTNNSSKNAQDYVKKLHAMGIDITEDEVLTSGEATRVYLKTHHPTLQRLFLLGTPALEEEFQRAGYRLVQDGGDVDAVVLGFDTTLTYQKLWQACDYLHQGVPYFATHPDLNCPLQGGRQMPDAGAMMAFFEAATTRTPVIIGKPHQPVVEVLAEKLKVPASKMIMVGDRLYTDMAMALEHGMRSVLVLSGETTKEAFQASGLSLDHVFHSVKDILPHL